MLTINDIMDNLPTEPRACDDNPGIWTNGDSILCETEMIAGAIAELLESICATDCVITGYYDPVEDKKNGEEDMCTGYYYITCD